MRGKSLIAAIAVLTWSTAAQADDDSICSDRPGKATSACTVPGGKWQIETGVADWSLQKSPGERDTVLTLGETLIKYGLNDSTDIGIDVTPYTRTVSHSAGSVSRESGIGDTIVQLKHMLSADKAPVKVTLLPYILLPTAKHNLGAGAVEAGLLLPVSYDIPHSKLSIGLTPEVDWFADSDGHGHHGAMTQVVTLGLEATEKLTVSAELWGNWDWDPSGTVRQYSADASLAYLVNDDTQIDVGANFGLNQATPDVELYTGVAVRF